MTAEDSAFMLTRIATLARDLSQEQTLICAVSAVAIIGAVLLTAGYLLRRYDTDHPIDRYFRRSRGDTLCCIGLIAGVVGVICTLHSYLDIYFTEAELDSLITAYETLYGPIPEGML